MARTPLKMLIGLMAFGALSACAESDPPLTILDAAEIYKSNRASFAAIRATYPGPFGEFKRAPARIPAEQTKQELDFVERLRQNFPLEFIDMFPLGDTGRDEIDVVLQRYQEKTNTTSIYRLHYALNRVVRSQ